MKLAKLSLAAVVAAGALTTVSAASLEESIKGVDISGMVRYRVDINETKNNTTGAKSSSDSHRFQGIATLSVPVAENLTSVISTRYNTNSNPTDPTKPENAENGQTGKADDRNVAISRAYFQFAANNMILKAGKMEIGSPWTDNNLLDGQSGNGLFAAFTGVEGWTFAAAHFFNTFAGYGDGNGHTKIIGTGDFASRDLTALAAIGSMGPVNARVWLAKMQSVFKHAAFLEVSTKFAGFNARAQVNSLKLTENTAEAVKADNKRGTFWGVEAGYNLENFGFKAGYTKNSKKQGIHSLEDDSEYIRAGKRLYTWSNNQADAKVWFLTANAKFSKYSFGAGYVKAKSKHDTETTGSKHLDGQEWYVDAGYAHSKNFVIDAYYSHVKFKDGKTGQITGNNANLKKHSRARVQATYKF